MINVFGFEEGLHALQLETDSDGKPCFAHQPFLEVDESLRPIAASGLLALLLSHALWPL